MLNKIKDVTFSQFLSLPVAVQTCKVLKKNPTFLTSLSKSSVQKTFFAAKPVFNVSLSSPQTQMFLRSDSQIQVLAGTEAFLFVCLSEHFDNELLDEMTTVLVIWCLLPCVSTPEEDCSSGSCCSYCKPMFLLHVLSQTSTCRHSWTLSAASHPYYLTPPVASTPSVPSAPGTHTASGRKPPETVVTYDTEAKPPKLILHRSVVFNL